MRFARLPVIASLLSFGVIALSTPADAQPAGQWASVKGQVVLPAGKEIPARKKLNVTQDKEHCLSKGDILDESAIIDPKTRGIKNVVVWLRPLDTKQKAFAPAQINPADKDRKPATVVVDQPCCMFISRITTARVGDTLVVKNPAPVAHNFMWTSSNNGDYNQSVLKGGVFKLPQPLVAENSAIEYKCTVHPWMNGYVRVFDHPYYAVTDETGKFEIKGAPVGKFRILYWQEKVGFLGGKDGRFGTEIDIPAAGVELKPVDFDITATK